MSTPDVESLSEVPVLFVGHGDLPEGVRSAVEMILGPQDLLDTVGIGPAADLTATADEITGALDRMQVDPRVGALVLADLHGGSPSNSAASVFLQRRQVRVVSGLSLPMALEVLADRQGRTADELTEVAVRAGQEGTLDVSALFAASSTEAVGSDGSADAGRP